MILMRSQVYICIEDFTKILNSAQPIRFEFYKFGFCVSLVTLWTYDCENSFVGYSGYKRSTHPC